MVRRKKRCYKAFYWDLVRTKRREEEVIIFFNGIQQWLEEEKKRSQVFFHGIWRWSKDVNNNKLQDFFGGLNDAQKTKRKVTFYFS